MKQSVRLAVIVAIVVFAWLLSGQFVNNPNQKEVSAHKEKQLMSVSVIDSQAEDINREIILQGQLVANENLLLRAQIAGSIQKIWVDEGNQVEQGQLLLQIDERDRRAQLTRIEADIAHKTINLQAMQKLTAKNLQSATNLALAKAELAAAKAERASLLVNLQHTQVKAPFAGVINQREVALGSYVEEGDSLFELVDISSITAQAFVNQQQVNRMHLGQRVSIVLLNGQTISANISFISEQAEPDTRSFRIEAEFDNRAGHYRAGGSIEMKVYADQTQGHQLPTSILTLNDQGELGVKALTQEQTVIFYPVNKISMGEYGIWVSGLPEHVKVISQGQNFVVTGEKVRTIASQDKQ